jgi:CRP-like cAMP-binding protein
VIAADAEDERLYLVREGTAAVLLSRDGVAIEVGLLERNAIFGEGRVLGEPRPGALVARTAVSVVTFPAPVMTVLADRFPRLRHMLEAVRAVRLKDAADKLGA